MLKRIVTVPSFVIAMILSSLAGCSGETDADSDGMSQDEVVSEVWVAQGTKVFEERNRVPNIPIIGKSYTADLSAYALAKKSISKGAYRGALILNPGAVVASTDMATFARTLARRGYIVYVANNPVDDVDEKNGGPARGPIPLLVGALVPNFAKALSQNPRQVKGMPTELVAVHEGWNAARTPRVVAIGHSLGGAVLGAAAGRSDTGLSKIILLGTDELVDAGFPFGLVPPAAGRTAVPLVLVRGEKDGLADATKLRTMAQKYPNAVVLPAVSGVNHFCVIDGNAGDPQLGKVGAPGKRAADGKSPLASVQSCVDAVVASIEGNLP